MPHKLLLADDSVTIQRVIELTFAGEDVEVITVGDGQKAIDRISTDRPDIVLTDIGMPERNGYEVAEFVKTHPDLKHIPVVLLTGAFEAVDEARVRAIGCDGWFVKPFEPQLVINRVRDLLQGRGSGAAWTPPPGQRPSSKGQAAEQPRDVPAAPPLAPERPPPASTAARPSPAPAVRAMASAPTTVARPPKPADAMEEYFDRLDAAFANLETLQPSQSDDRQVEDGRDQELHRGEPSGSHKPGEELENWDLDTVSTNDSAPQTSNLAAASDSDRRAASPPKPRAPSARSAPPVRQASSAPPVPPVRQAPPAPPVRQASSAPPAPPVRQAPSAPSVRQASSAPPAPPVRQAPPAPPVRQASSAPPAPPVRQASSAPPAPPVPQASSAPPAPPVPQAPATPPAPPVPQASSAPPAPPVPQAPATPPAPPVPQASSAPPAPPVPQAPATPPAPPAPPAKETAQPSQPADAPRRAEPAPAPAPAPIPVPTPSLADAFTALLAAEQRIPGWSGTTQPRSQAGAPVIPDGLVEELTRRVLDGATDRAVRDVVTDTVSQVAERLVRDEIERIKTRGK